MKILTGNWRGKPIYFKPNPFLRPTADKARKALFDMLQGEVQGKRVLDLFSGTGALGLEALSNGAQSVTFVESNPHQASTIGRNLEAFQATSQAKVLAQDALAAIEGLYERQEIFDLIFADPPYDQGLGKKTLELLARLPVRRSGTLIFLECHRREPELPEVGELKLLKSKPYGDAKILIYT